MRDQFAAFLPVRLLIAELEHERAERGQGQRERLAVAVGGERDGLVGIRDLPETVTGMGAVFDKAVQIPKQGVDFESLVMQFEKQYFLHHIRREEGNMSRVADRVGLERTHLYRKLKQLGVDLSRNKRGTPV